MGNSHAIYETHSKRTRTQSNIFCFISTINCYCSGELDLKSKPLCPIVCFPVFCLSISSSLFNFSHSIHCRTFLREKIEKNKNHDIRLALTEIVEQHFRNDNAFDILPAFPEKKVEIFNQVFNKSAINFINYHPVNCIKQTCTYNANTITSASKLTSVTQLIFSFYR